jgi:LuxR family maltose regulon positive regulatory protein
LLVKLLWQEMPEAIPELNRRASDWYELSGMAEEAIDHALASKNFDRAADLIGKSIADCFWNRGETITISRWLEALPEERVLSQPELCAYYALALFLSGQLGKAEARLEAADKLLEPQASFEELSISGNRRLAEQKGMLAAVRAYFAYFKGDALTIIKFAHQALELLPEGNTFWHNSAAINLGDAYSMSGNLAAAQQAYSEAMKASRSVGNLFLGLLAGSKLAVALKNQGHLRSAEQLCRELIQLANTSEQPRAEITGKVYAIWGDILCEWNELERAESYLRKAVEMCQREGNVAALGLAYLYLLRVLWSRQDFSAMEETLLKIEKLAQGASIPVWINRSIIAWKTWVWIKQGRLEEAAQMLREFGVSLDHDPVFRAEGEYMSLARLLIAQGRLAEAGRLLDQLYADAEASGMLVWRIVFLAMHALAFEAQGMREEAIASLERALSFAEPEGYVQVFLEEGAPMASLIYKAAARGIAPQYAGRLLAAFSGRPPALDSRSAQNDELIEPLSQREIEVLRLLAEGLSNQEIAGRLYLSVRTVKFHTGNIYSKLGVKRRTEAVAKGRALGLVIL